MSDRLSRLADFISKANPTFEDLSPEDQILAKALTQNNRAFLVNDLPRLLYDQVPLTIEEFLTTDALGLTADAVFPVWRQALTENIFAPHSKVREIIFTGATGTGKSRTADLCVLYNLYRVLCFKNPQIMFGVTPATTLANISISVDLKKAWLAMLKPFVETLRASRVFTEVHKESDFQDYAPFDKQFPFYVDQHRNIIYFPKNIILFSGSQETHTISMSLMGATLDEIEFRRSANSIQAGMGLYLTIKERMENRFLDIPWLMLCLVSSAKSSEGVIPTYIEKIPKESLTTKIFSYAVWEVRDFDVYRQGYFYVLKGNKIVPSRVLSAEECKAVEAGKFSSPLNSKIIKVPEAHRQTFEQNVSRALRNTAGEIDIDELFIFDEYEPLEKYNPDLSPELHLTADMDLENPVVINQIPTRNFVVYDEAHQFLKRAPKAKRYCFTGDTKVKLLDGRTLTMVELLKEYESGKENWVYSYDTKKGWNPGKVSNVFLSKTVRTLTTIILDNNEVIRCTPEHKFMLRTGEYQEARHLQSGTSLMPLYYRKSTRGYEYLLDNQTKRWVPTYKISDPMLSWKDAVVAPSDYFLVRHHKDFDKRNNNPTNLQVIGGYSHIRLHGNHADKCGFTKQWKSKKFRRQMKKVSSRSGHKNGPKNMFNNWHGPNSEAFRKMMKPIQGASGARSLVIYNKSQHHREIAKQLMTRLRRDPRYSEMYKSVLSENGKRTAALTNSNPRVIQARQLGILINYGRHLIKTYGEITRSLWNENKTYPNLPNYDTMLRRVKTLQRLKTMLGLRNHKVGQVTTETVEPTDVYDLTVDSLYNNHNFALGAGIVVSNCHIDLAEVTEAGVTLCHKELGEHNTILYVIDFACLITSPSRIDLESVAKLVSDFEAKYNVQYGKITADQYQSSFLLQRFKKAKLAEVVEHLSVDKTLDAYHRVAANISNIRIGHCPTLLEQAKSIKEVNNKLTSRVRKDLLDSLVGSVFNAICDVRSEPEYSYAHESSKPVVKPEPPSKKLEEL